MPPKREKFEFREQIDHDRSNQAKTVYFFISTLNKRVKSKEEYKNKVVHYPFYKDGSPKYSTIRTITYEGPPKVLPRGFNKTPSTGYGFTKIFSPVIKLIEDKYAISNVLISPEKETGISGATLTLNIKSIDSEYPKLHSLALIHSGEKKFLVESIARTLFPQYFPDPVKKYTGGGLARYIERSIKNPNDLSEADINAVVELISDRAELFDRTKVLKTKEKIEEYYIEDVIEQFEAMLALKNMKNPEERWQMFFKTYNWIFSLLFSTPVAFYEDKAYVGGKSIEDKEGKIADFLYKNKLSDNVAIIEIKTHNTGLLRASGKAYRGSDVFAVTDELTGAINQVLDQRDVLQKSFYSLGAKAGDPFESYNSKCVVVAGQYNRLSNEQRKSFELFRSNSKDVEIITFDEILEKLKALKLLMQGKGG